MREKAPPIREPLRILYQTQFHGKGLAIGVDSFNWVVVHFNPGQCPLDSRQRWYFSNLPDMLLALHKYFVKERIKRLGFLDMVKAVELSYKQVKKIGSGNGARNPPSGSVRCPAAFSMRSYTWDRQRQETASESLNLNDD